MSFSSSTFAQPHPRLVRIEALQQGKLPLNGITILAQEILDANEVNYWGPNVHRVVMHLIDCGICKQYTPQPDTEER